MNCLLWVESHAALFQIEIQCRSATQAGFHQVRRQRLLQAPAKGAPLLLKIFVCGLSLLGALAFFSLFFSLLLSAALSVVAIAGTA